MPAGELLVDTADEHIVQRGTDVDFRFGLPHKKRGQLFSAHVLIGRGVIPLPAVPGQLLHRHLGGRIIVLFVKGKADIQFLQAFRQTESVGDLADEFSAEQSLDLI